MYLYFKSCLCFLVLVYVFLVFVCFLLRYLWLPEGLGVVSAGGGDGEGGRYFSPG